MDKRRSTSNSYYLPILVSFFTLLSSQVFAQQEPLLVPLTDVSTNKLPYIVAKEEGLFDKYGISIELYMTPGASLKGHRGVLGVSLGDPWWCLQRENIIKLEKC